MPSPQVTAAGLALPSLAELREQVRAELRGRFGPGIYLGPESVMALLADVLTLQHHEALELARDLGDAFNPATAIGVWLDLVCALVGVFRQPATHSTGAVTLAGTTGTVIPAGTVVRVAQGPRFVTVHGATIGVSGAVDVLIRAEQTGPVEAAAGTITEKVTAIAGWDSVVNAEDIDPGQAVESDTALRARREASLQIVGAGVDQAIRARLEQLEDVQAAVVISNRTLVTDSNGIPGKSFMAVVWPDSVSGVAIAQAIWETMPAGILPYGAQQATITDSQGYNQTVGWSWATELPLYLEAVLTVSSAYPLDGDDRVAAALLAAYRGMSLEDLIAVFGAGSLAKRFAEHRGLSIGDDVILLDGVCAARDAAKGVLTCTLRAKFGSAPGPGDTSNLTVLLTQIARADATRIVVTSV